MDRAEIIVTITGLLLSAFVVWFFLLARRQSSRATVSSGVQEITVKVQGGYDPERIVVKKGTPVRLNFFRNETDPCTDHVIFPDFGINRELPAYQTTSISIVPDKPGEYNFTCGMSMLRGTLVVEDSQ